MSAKRLVYHQTNGAIVVQTLDAKGNVTHRDLIVRLVYADAALAAKLVETVREHLGTVDGKAVE